MKELHKLDFFAKKNLHFMVLRYKLEMFFLIFAHLFSIFLGK